MTLFIEKERIRLLKRYKALINKYNIDDYSTAIMLVDYEVDSIEELTAYDLLHLCNRIEFKFNPPLCEADKWRKRVIASIGGYLSLMGRDNNITLIKAIATRATGYKEFNKIPVSRLRNIYQEFRNKQKDMQSLGKALDFFGVPNVNTIISKKEKLTDKN